MRSVWNNPQNVAETADDAHSHTVPVINSTVLTTETGLEEGNGFLDQTLVSPKRIKLKVEAATVQKLDEVLQKHQAVVDAALTKMVKLKNDFTEDEVRFAFEHAHKDQLLEMLHYGIDIFSPFCSRSKGGEEAWVIDFYGRYSELVNSRDLLAEHKLVIMKEYKRQTWKISLVGGSVRRWNGRRHFIVFLERYVMNNKFKNLKESTKRIFSIATIQSGVVSYL